MALPLVNDATQPSVPQHRLAQSPLCTAASLHRVACCAIIEFGASFVFLFSSLSLSDKRMKWKQWNLCCEK